MLISTATMAQQESLSGETLRGVVVGKTVNLHTPVGSIPITYKANGTMVGIARNMQAYTGRERDQGTWWIAGPQLCQRWESWLEGRSYCFTLRFAGQVVHWRRSDGQSGLATIVHK